MRIASILRTLPSHCSVPRRTLRGYGISILASVLVLALLVCGAFIGRGRYASAEDPTPTPTLGPFTPTFSYTFDEVAPDNSDVPPADDDCPVGAPCKSLWSVQIPDGQPLSAISGVVFPYSAAAYTNPAVIPDGAINGKVSISQRVGPVGRCATEGTIVQFGWTGFDGTIDASTTTGSPSDLCSFSHWPTQLNGIRDSLLAANPGSALWGRGVGCTPWWPINTLSFSRSDGGGFYTVVVGDPTAPPTPPTDDSCGPQIIKSLALGVSADNPDTPEDEGGIPLLTCTAPGTHTITASLDRNDTPPGDPVVLEDTATCSPNTPAGSSVSVPLNGGTGTLTGIDLTFSQVTGAGSTSIVTTTAGPAPPSGFRIVGLEELPLYFDINTDASYSGDLTVCLRYDETQVTGPEADLKMMHYVDEGFVDITTSVHTGNDIICGVTTHLSTFVVAELAPTATPSPTVTTTPTPTETRTPTPTRTQTPVPPTATFTPHPTPHGVGGAVMLPPAAMDDASSGTSGDSGQPVATWIVLAGAVAGALAMGGWYARSRRRSR